jgi:hypothetical protein
MKSWQEYAKTWVNPNRLHISIRKALPFKDNPDFSPWKLMWYGYCDSCHKTWQFHFFGATLGYGLEHLRRHGCK